MEGADYVLFEKYLSGNMSPREKTSFRQRLNTDKDFAESFASYQQITDFLQREFAAEEEEEAFKSNVSDISASYFQKESENRGGLSWWKWLAAACVLFAVSLYFFQKPGLPAYDDFADIQPISLAVRGENNALTLKAESAFNSGRYEAAATYFAELLGINNDYTELRVYQAIALIETDEFEEADIILDNLIRSQTPFQYEAIWYKALGKLKQKEYDACKELLSSIPSRASQYTKAQKLLDKLP